MVPEILSTTAKTKQKRSAKFLKLLKKQNILDLSDQTFSKTYNRNPRDSSIPPKKTIRFPEILLNHFRNQGAQRVPEILSNNFKNTRRKISEILSNYFKNET